MTGIKGVLKLDDVPFVGTTVDAFDLLVVESRIIIGLLSIITESSEMGVAGLLDNSWYGVHVVIGLGNSSTSQLESSISGLFEKSC